MNKGLIALFLITSQLYAMKEIYGIKKDDGSIVTSYLGKFCNAPSVIWKRIYADGSEHIKILREKKIKKEKCEILFFHKGSDPSAEYKLIAYLDESLFLKKTARRISEV